LYSGGHQFESLRHRNFLLLYWMQWECLVTDHICVLQRVSDSLSGSHLSLYWTIYWWSWLLRMSVGTLVCRLFCFSRLSLNETQHRANVVHPS
jgi:hypothetical protein